jgi:hypothetical protein
MSSHIRNCTSVETAIQVTMLLLWYRLSNVACRPVAMVMASTHVAEERVTYAVMSHNNRRAVASGDLCGSTSRLYDSTQFSWTVSAVQLSTVECSELIGELQVRELLQFSRCEQFLLDASS